MILCIDYEIVVDHGSIILRANPDVPGPPEQHGFYLWFREDGAGREIPDGAQFVPPEAVEGLIEALQDMQRRRGRL